MMELPIVESACKRMFARRLKRPAAPLQRGQYGMVKSAPMLRTLTSLEFVSVIGIGWGFRLNCVTCYSIALISDWLANLQWVRLGRLARANCV